MKVLSVTFCIVNRKWKFQIDLAAGAVSWWQRRLLQRSAVQQSPLDLNVSMNFDHFENSSIQVFSQYWGSQEFQVQEKRLLVLLCPADPTCPESVTILCWRQSPDYFFLLSTRLYETFGNYLWLAYYPLLTPPANAKTTFFSKILKYMASWLSYLFVWPQYAHFSILRLSSWWIEKKSETNAAKKCKLFSWLRN